MTAVVENALKTLALKTLSSIVEFTNNLLLVYFLSSFLLHTIIISEFLFCNIIQFVIKVQLNSINEIVFCNLHRRLIVLMEQQATLCEHLLGVFSNKEELFIEKFLNSLQNIVPMFVLLHTIIISEFPFTTPFTLHLFLLVRDDLSSEPQDELSATSNFVLRYVLHTNIISEFPYRLLPLCE